MRLLLHVLALGSMLSMTAAFAADKPIQVAPDRNCHVKCAKTYANCTAAGTGVKECSRVNRACTRACAKR